MSVSSSVWSTRRWALTVVRLIPWVGPVMTTTLIGYYVDAVVGLIDGPKGWLDRAIFSQTLELRQDVFDSPTELPYGPPTSITSVKYLDENGTEQTLASNQYVLTNAGKLELAYNVSWPNIRGDVEGVRIRYVVGYATLPPAILAAILLMVGDLYAFRETAQVGSIAGKIPMSPAVENLLAPYRIWSV